MPNDEEARRHVLEHFGNIFTELAQLALAARALAVCRQVSPDLTAKVGRNRAALAILLRWLGLSGCVDGIGGKSASMTLFSSPSSSWSGLCGIFSDFCPNCCRCALASCNSRCSMRLICAITILLNAEAPIFSSSDWRTFAQTMCAVCHDYDACAQLNIFVN
jgi:hypothetical protein